MNFRISLVALLSEIRYSLSLLSAEPEAAAHVPIFKALKDEVRTVLLQELDILEALSNAQAAVDKADEGLDSFAGRVYHLVEDITGGHPNHPLKVNLFHGKSIAKYRRPVLRSQLASMSSWPLTFEKSGNATLTAMIPELNALLAAAEKAVKMKKDAAAQNRRFRDVGERKQFIDKVNAARKKTHGDLAQLPSPPSGALVIAPSIAIQLQSRPTNSSYASKPRRQNSLNTLASVHSRNRRWAEE